MFQPALLGIGGPIERHELGAGAWVDLARGWLGDDADGLFVSLLEVVPWQAERRRMYDRVVAVPRLVHFSPAGAPLPDPRLGAVRDRLSDAYADELGEPFATVGLCLYRDGRDSVAWHGDTIGRARWSDTLVAIVSLGAARRLALRPVGGGASRSYVLGHGDLLVMGGTCQRTWQHSVPKTARAVGPRISVQFRPDGVR